MSQKEPDWKQEQRERKAIFKGLLYGLFLGVLGNIWASFLIKILEFDDYTQSEWVAWFIILTLILFGLIVMFLIFYAMGYYVDFQRGVNEYKSYWKEFVDFLKKLKGWVKKKKKE